MPLAGHFRSRQSVVRLTFESFNWALLSRTNRRDCSAYAVVFPTCPVTYNAVEADCDPSRDHSLATHAYDFHAVFQSRDHSLHEHRDTYVGAS